MNGREEEGKDEENESCKYWPRGVGRGVFVGGSLTEEYSKHFCSFCLQMRVRTNIY